MWRLSGLGRDFMFGLGVRPPNVFLAGRVIDFSHMTLALFTSCLNYGYVARVGPAQFVFIRH